MITLRSMVEAAARFGKTAPAAPSAVLSWGNFDGMHLGHQALLSAARKRSDSLGLPLLVLTFEPRPAVYFNPHTAPRAITDLDDRLSLLAALGVDYTLALPFGPELANLEPADFLHRLALDQLGARALVLGYDPAFGKGGRQGGGNRDFLQQQAAKYGFELDLLAPFSLEPGGRAVSSTWVRERVGAGDLNGLPELLGRQHSVHGQVRQGFQRGRHLGFATANLDPGPLLLPPPGTYACLARCQGQFAAAACNLGVNPSFGNGEISLEAHLLDFSGDLYGHDLRLYFIKRLRSETAFPNPQALAAQIALDVAETRACIEQTLRDPEFSRLYPL